MVPSYPNAPSHLLRGSMCAIDSGHKRVRDAGAACVFRSEDVEQRLMAYYGPKLPERTLPPASWQYVRHRLGAQAGTRCRSRLRLQIGRRRAAPDGLLWSQATRTHPPTCFVAVCAPSTRGTSGYEMQEPLASSDRKT